MTKESCISVGEIALLSLLNCIQGPVCEPVDIKAILPFVSKDLCTHAFVKGSHFLAKWQLDHFEHIIL